MADGQRNVTPAFGTEAYSAGDGGKPSVPKRRHCWLRSLAWTFAALVLLLVITVTAGWAWLGSSSSLAFALDRAAPYLPEGQQLTSEGVSGSLRRGGHIERIIWKSESLSVEANDINIGWSLFPLLHKKVQLGKVDIASVVFTPTPKPDKLADPLTPLEKLMLPVQVDVPFSIARLVWAGPPEQSIRSLSGRYRYDGKAHLLDLAGMDLPQGQVSGTARLQGAAPMALAAQFKAQLGAPMPGGGSPLEVSILANAKGNLAGQAARIEVDARLQQLSAAVAESTSPFPETRTLGASKDATRPTPGAMHAALTAAIAPWARQPLLQTDALLADVNLAALQAGAPITQLSGHVKAGPAESGWDIEAQLKNARPGPIDTRALPLSALDLQARFDGTVWTVPKAVMEAAAGTVVLSGSFEPGTQTLDARGTLTHLNPATLHTRLAAAPVDGTLSARGTVQDLGFQMQLAASGNAKTRKPTASSAAPLRIDRVVASGHWKDGVLTLPKAEIDALSAQVRASDVRVVTRPALAITATASAKVPGANLRLNGRIAETSGEGTLEVKLGAAQDTLAWLRTLPGLDSVAPGLSTRGSATLSADWNGGWATLAAVPSSRKKAGDSKASRGKAEGIRATLNAPRLQIDIPQGDGVQTLKADLQDVQLTADGSASSAIISLKGQVREGKRSLVVDTALQAGIARPDQGKALTAQASIQRLTLRAQDGVRKGPWTVTLDAPVAVDFAKASTGDMSVNASAASASVAAPVPGKVALRWEPVTFKQSASGAVLLQTKGSITGVPLAWTDLISGEKDSPLKKFGLDTNLVFGGQWNVRAADKLSAQVKLQRISGDLRIATEGDAPATSIRSTGSAPDPKAATRDTSSTISAGVRTIELSLDASGSDVRARFVWDSERAGVVRAELASRLTRNEKGWSWPEDTPLTGKVRAQLPQVGVWSVLAPPGWRVNGTLDADVALSGSRADPRWQGVLSADQLAVQSLLDGVDLKDGRLLARLSGNRVDITEFRLQGGSGNSARIPGFSGNLTSAPTNGGSLDGSGSVQWGGTSGALADNGSSLRMDFKARAKSLQVLVRADRQASVSGTLEASLRDRQFKLRGDLTIDRASIILPDAGAPSLGDDVVVRSAALDKKALEGAQAAATTAAKAETVLPPDVAVTLDLGTDFALQGLGITTRLEGKVTVRSNKQAGAPPTVVGEVRTVAGRYRAWGQQLDVETGLIRFNGPYDNPSLDILALRPNIEVRAGVQVSGSAKNPRVRLYSEPELPDAEKLAWVVLGRSAAGGGAEAAVLQQAALALLGGRNGGGAGTNVASKLGLDEIGFKGPGAGADASGAALTFGKRLSKDLYVTYERSLSGTLGTLYIFYDLTKRLRLRGQTGANTGLDLIYTIRYE